MFEIRRKNGDLKIKKKRKNTIINIMKII